MAVHRDPRRLFQTIPAAEYCCGNLHGQQKWESTQYCSYLNVTMLCFYCNPVDIYSKFLPFFFSLIAFLQWQSCLTSQMQPQSRKWSTVFHVLGWARTLVFHRPGKKHRSTQKITFFVAVTFLTLHVKIICRANVQHIEKRWKLDNINTVDTYTAQTSQLSFLPPFFFSVTRTKGFGHWFDGPSRSLLTSQI